MTGIEAEGRERGTGRIGVMDTSTPTKIMRTTKEDTGGEEDTAMTTEEEEGEEGG